MANGDAGTDVVIAIRGLDRLIKRFDRAQRYFLTEDLMSEIANYLIAKIQLRTSQGVDASGAPFIPYSPGWALFRQKTGHPTDKVNLFFHGTMMSSMTFSATKDSARIFFLPTMGKPYKYKTKSGDTRERKQKITSAQKAYFLNEDRRFFAISASEQQQILNMIGDHLRDLVFTDSAE
jgi:hypothetical protein